MVFDMYPINGGDALAHPNLDLAVFHIWEQSCPHYQNSHTIDHTLKIQNPTSLSIQAQFYPHVF